MNGLGSSFEPPNYKSRPSSSYQNGRDVILPKKKNKDRSSSGNKASSSTKEQGGAKEEARAINQSLMRTKQMMNMELERLSHASETIQNDENALKDIRKDQQSLDGAVKGSKGALGQMKRQDQEEMIVLSCSIAFFVLTAIFVIWSRIRIPFFF